MRSKGISLAALLTAAALTGPGLAQSRNAVEPAPVTRIAQAAAPKKGAETRAARPQEVRVRVLLLGESQRDNPEEYVEVGGVRYIHFKSPRLKSPGRPLGEPRLRYPAGQIAQKNGAVILQLLIDERGSLVRTDVVCAAPPFVKSALESVEGLKFRPAVAREGPVKSYMLVEFGYGRGFPCGRIPD